MPVRLLNQALCEEYVRNDIDSLSDVPKKYRSYPIFDRLAPALDKIMPYISDYKNNTAMTDDEYNKLLVGIFLCNRASEFAKAFSPEMYYEMCMQLISNESNIELSFFRGMKDVLTDEKCKQVILAAFQKNKMALWNAPKDLVSFIDYKMCLEMVQENSSFLRSPTFKIFPFTDEQYKAIVMIAVKDDGNLLNYVNEQFRSYELCLESVKQNGDAIQYIVSGQNDNLSDIQYRNLLMTAVKQKGLALKYIPTQEWDYELCCESIKQDITIMDSIAKDWKNSKLTEDEYKRLYNIAVGLNGNVVSLIPKEQRVFELMLKAVENAGTALQWTEASLLTEDQYRKLCIAAVKSMPIALKYVPDKFKNDVINTVGLEYLVIPNFAVTQFLPSHYRDDQDRVLASLLSKVAHIVVTEGVKLYDTEINDSYMVYANTKSRMGKTIHTDKENLERLLADIKKYQGDIPQINLVMLGHCNNVESTRRLAGVQVTEMRDLLADHPAISRITLLGCDTVNAMQLDVEREMIRKYQDTLKQPKEITSGLVLSYKVPEQTEYEKLFRMTDKDKNGGHPGKLYVYVNGIEGQKCVIELTRDAASQAISAKRYEALSDDCLKALDSLSKGKKAKVAQQSQIIYIRSGKSADNLNTRETAQLSAELEGAALRFSPTHPSYKEDKKMFPFLTGGVIDASEEKKLMQSLTKTLVELIRADDRIKREIIVKGYNKPLHVDTKEKQIKATRTHLYTSEYDKHHETFFSKSRDNIDRKKLERDRKSEIRNMTEDDTDHKSKLKSITVRVKK